MKLLIDKFKKKRKIKAISKQYKAKYAFVGIGNHSLGNLYPVLQYLKVDIKYIVAKSQDTVDAINVSYDNSEGTIDFDKVLNDSEIAGIFISTNPESHFSLVKKALEKGKNVFVEKPPCSNREELNELIELEKSSGANVLVGFQKRYAQVYSKLKGSVDSGFYSLNYCTGMYPEGDALIDLFIHPIDVINYIFGKANILSVININENKSNTILLHVKHDNGVYGNIELSTAGWWASAKESIMYNSSKYIFETTNTQKLVKTNKPKSVAGIPLEKIKTPEIVQTVMYEQNSFLPVAENNEVYSAGYFGELDAFLDMCENNKQTRNVSGLADLVNTYSTIEGIINFKNV